MGFSRRLAKDHDMKLQGVGADDVKEVRGGLGNSATPLYKHHMIANPARSKRDSRQAKTHVDHLLFRLVDDMHSMWEWTLF